MKTCNFTKPITMAAATAIGVGIFTMAAHAAQAPTRVVRYSIHDLDTPAGAEVLYRRIRDAAEQVCGDVHSRLLTEAVAAKACVRDAVDGSIRSIGNAKMAQAYELHVASLR
jgi:UrcA family protein